MKEFQDLVLCDYSDENIAIHVRASLTNGELLLSGDDLGKTVEDFWDDEDYEYWYSLDAAGTKKLLEVIGGTENPEEAVKREFSGTDGCRRFAEICHDHDIRYGFSSYV